MERIKSSLGEAMHVKHPLSLSVLYRPRSQGDNTFGSVRPSVRPSVCPSVRPSETQVSYTLKKHHKVVIFRSIQNSWVFKMVAVSTGCAIAVDNAFNLRSTSPGCLKNMRQWPNQQTDHLVISNTSGDVLVKVYVT